MRRSLRKSLAHLCCFPLKFSNLYSLQIMIIKEHESHLLIVSTLYICTISSPPPSDGNAICMCVGKFILKVFQFRIDQKNFVKKCVIQRQETIFQNCTCAYLDEWILLFNVQRAAIFLDVIFDVWNIWPHGSADRYGQLPISGNKFKTKGLHAECRSLEIQIPDIVFRPNVIMSSSSTIGRLLKSSNIEVEVEVMHAPPPPGVPYGSKHRDAIPLV